MNGGGSGAKHSSRAAVSPERGARHVPGLGVAPRVDRPGSRRQSCWHSKMVNSGEHITLRPRGAGASVQKERGVRVFRAGGAPLSSDDVERARAALRTDRQLDVVKSLP